MRNCYEGDCYQISMGGFIAMLFFARFPAKVGLKWAHAHTHIYIYMISVTNIFESGRGCSTGFKDLFWESN